MWIFLSLKYSSDGDEDDDDELGELLQRILFHVITISVCLCAGFETGSHVSQAGLECSLAQDDFELVILLLLPHKCCLQAYIIMLGYS